MGWGNREPARVAGKGGNDLLRNERLKQIMALLERRKLMSINDIHKTLFVSTSTLRRDLTILEQMGLVIHRYGQIEYVTSNTQEQSYLFREQNNEQEKKQIAEIASTFLADNMAIFMDSSTTVSFLAPYLRNLRNMVVITNGLRLAVALDEMPAVKTFVTGGQLRAGTGALLGTGAEAYLNQFQTDLAFISCSGVTAETVFMASTSQSGVKQQMLALSKQAVLLADHTKVGVDGYYRLIPVAQLTAVITDREPAPEILTAWNQTPAEVLFPE